MVIDLYCSDTVKSRSPNEKERSQQDKEEAKSIRCITKRRQFLAGRFFVRSILSRYVGIEPHDISIHRNSFGKPYVPGPWFFNLSHSGSKIALAVSEEDPVGIDIAKDDERVARELSLYLRELGLCLPFNGRYSLSLWTQLEASIKARGKGWRRAKDLHALYRKKRRLKELDLPWPGFVGTLAVCGRSSFHIAYRFFP